MSSTTRHSDEVAWTEYPAQGISMGRSWRGARSLLVHGVSSTQVAWADVIVYRAGLGLVAHRVVGRRLQDGQVVWYTKGDGYWTPDRVAVMTDQLVGVVRAIRWADRCEETIRTWSGYAHAVVGWLGLWIWRPLRTQRTQNDARK